MYDSKAYAKKDNVQTVEKMYEQFRPYTKEEFLNQLPEKVMRYGKVIPIRSEIAKKLGVIDENSAGGEVEVNTEVVLKEKKGEVFNKEDITIIKVRSDKGKNVVLIKVLAKDNIDVIYKYAENYK